MTIYICQIRWCTYITKDLNRLGNSVLATPPSHSVRRMKITVFKEVMLSHLADKYLRFENGGGNLLPPTTAHKKCRNQNTVSVLQLKGYDGSPWPSSFKGFQSCGRGVTLPHHRGLCVRVDILKEWSMKITDFRDETRCSTVKKKLRGICCPNPHFSRSW